MISSYMGFIGEDNLFATFIRRSTFILAIFTIIIGITNKIYTRYLTKASLFLVLFYIIYYFVIYYDLYVLNISNSFFSKLDKKLILVRMSSLVFIPVVASLAIRTEGFNSKGLVKAIYWALTISLALALSVMNLGFGEVVDNRLEIDSELNSLNMGYWSATLFLIILYIYSQLKNKSFFLIYVPGLLLSLYLMIAAGSRGPIIYSFIIFYYFLTSIGLSKKIKRLINFTGVLLFLVILVDYTVFTDFIGDYNTDLEKRFISSIEKQETSGRDKIFIKALEQFSQNPLFGDYFVLKTGRYMGQYPHNIFLEALITFGLAGAIPFFIFIVKTFKRAHHLIKTNHEMSWLCLIFLISFFKGLSTWTLYGNSLLWMSMFIILTYKVKNIKKKS